MKRKILLLLASLLLLPWAMRAQVSVLSEGFEGGSIPAGWTIMDADGDNHNWMIATNLISTGMISMYSHTGTNFVLSESFDDIIEKNVAYLLGDNSNKKSYVVGFTKNGANAPKSLSNSLFVSRSPRKAPTVVKQPRITGVDSSSSIFSASPTNL